jgi:phage pi2 protein 07
MFLPNYYRFTYFALANRLTWLTKLLYKSPNLVNRIPIFGGLIFKPMEKTTQSIKELYEKDFYLWVQENLRFLKNREYDLVDWDNLLEEIPL